MNLAEFSNKYIESVLNSSMVFDYSNHYYHNNTLDSFEEFHLSTKDFEEFKELSLEEKYNADDKIQSEINQLKKVTNKEGFIEMDARFDVLKTALHQSKLKLIDEFKNEIVQVLEGEIIKRYFYREGMYAYFIATNEDVFEAQEILNDQNKYQKILK